MKENPHASDLRVGRVSLPRTIYLVTTTTAERRPSFADIPLATVACRSIHTALAPSTLWCWVLMPDHFHGLIELADTDTLSAAMRRFKARTARAINQHRLSTERVWQKSFHDHALRSTEDVLTVARYVVANPIRAGLVSKAREYPFWNANWI